MKQAIWIGFEGNKIFFLPEWQAASVCTFFEAFWPFGTLLMHQHFSNHPVSVNEELLPCDCYQNNSLHCSLKTKTDYNCRAIGFIGPGGAGYRGWISTTVSPLNQLCFTQSQPPNNNSLVLLVMKTVKLVLWHACANPAISAQFWHRHQEKKKGMHVPITDLFSKFCDNPKKEKQRTILFNRIHCSKVAVVKIKELKGWFQSLLPQNPLRIRWTFAFLATKLRQMT